MDLSGIENLVHQIFSPADAGHNAALQKGGHTQARPPERSTGGTASVHPVEIHDPSEREAVEKVKLDSSTLRETTSERAFKAAAGELIKEAKEGKRVTFSIDTTIPMTDINGKPVKTTQAELLYQQLKIAYPDRAFVFSKPDLKPGDKGYTEIPAPDVQTDGLRISTKENAITTSLAFRVANGVTIPPGSRFAVGTTFDGKHLKSADPTGKVWAISPDGHYLEVAGPGESSAFPASALSSDPKLEGQIVNRKTADGHQYHIIVRTTKEADPDGKPLLDAYPSGGASFDAAYKQGSKPGYFAVQPKRADHFRLPENVTVQANTAYGESTASGADQAYFMTSGFADQKKETAENYTGETDPRSAQELLRIRKESGFTEPTQVEAGLHKTQSAALSEDESRTWQRKSPSVLSHIGNSDGADHLPIDHLTPAELSKLAEMRRILEPQSNLSDADKKRIDAIKQVEAQLSRPNPENATLVERIRSHLGDKGGGATAVIAILGIAAETLNERRAEGRIAPRAKF
jgi:hypothetical protein